MNKINKKNSSHKTCLLSSIAPSFLSGTKSSLQATLLHLQYIVHNMYTQLDQSLRVFILSILIQLYSIAKPQNLVNFTVLTTICLHAYMYNPFNSSPVFISPSSLIGQSSALIVNYFIFRWSLHLYQIQMSDLWWHR